jgi:hypothetical protein
MYALTDRWQAYIDAGWAKAQEATGPRPESTCTAVQYGRKLGEVTIREALAAAEAEGEPALELLRWLAANMLEALAPETRAAMLAAIGRLDPPSAAALYCWHPHLNDEEDKILEAAFLPTLALMRQKIEAGTLTRAKSRD